MRAWDGAAFDREYADMTRDVRWQEIPEYYPRYRTRYKTILRRFAHETPAMPVDVLDIGGGQLSYLAMVLWGDRATVADLDTTCFSQLRSRGIDTFEWDLARDDPPTGRTFDAIFFSEVIEHLPVPGHVALERLRGLLRPGGLLICSTPNLYRLRNAVYLLRGRAMFDRFALPGECGGGHVLEYSAEHLDWQFQRAGFCDYSVELDNFTHIPQAPVDRVLALVGTPLRRIPRYRENVLVLAKAP